MNERQCESAFSESLADFAVNLASISDLNRCCDFITARAVDLLGADEGAIYLETRPLFGDDAPSRLTAPLQTQNETLGILAVTRRSPAAAFEPDDERRLPAVRHGLPGRLDGQIPQRGHYLFRVLVLVAGQDRGERQFRDASTGQDQCIGID